MRAERARERDVLIRAATIVPSRDRKGADGATRRRRSTPSVRAFLALICMAGALTLSACTQKKATDEPDTSIEPIVKTAERGPVTMIITADRSEITIADRLNLTIEVLAEDGVDVEMPEFGQQLEAFAIRNYTTESRVPVGGKYRWRQEYELDIFLSGSYAVPALTTRFVDRRKGEDDVVESSVTTDSFEVTVTPLMEGEFDPTVFRDVKGPVELSISRTWTWLGWAAGGLAAAVVLFFLALWLIRRARRPVPEIIIPPHEWAFEQLQRLADEQLVEQGQVHEFYYRLSMIVRVYIERRFNLRAPEQTTEEFLVEVRRNSLLATRYRDMLGQFLAACDMVKYALYEPQVEEIEQAFNAARDFVDQTALRTPSDKEKVAA